MPAPLDIGRFSWVGLGSVTKSNNADTFHVSDAVLPQSRSTEAPEDRKWQWLMIVFESEFAVGGSVENRVDSTVVPLKRLYLVPRAATSAGTADNVGTDHNCVAAPLGDAHDIDIGLTAKNEVAIAVTDNQFQGTFYFYGAT